MKENELEYYETDHTPEDIIIDDVSTVNNIPYRGYSNHGVDIENEFDPEPDELDYQSQLEETKRVENPTIANVARFFSIVATKASMQVIGKELHHVRKLVLTAIDADIYISAEREVESHNSYLLKAGEQLEIVTTSAIYTHAASGNSILSVAVTYG